jgi:hypothetical protein
MMRAPGGVGRESAESLPDVVPREHFRFDPRAFPQCTTQTPLEGAASLFPSLVEPAIERSRLRAPSFVIPINDHWMTSESQVQPAGLPSELVPPLPCVEAARKCFGMTRPAPRTLFPLMFLAMMVPDRSIVELLYSLNSGILTRFMVHISIKQATLRFHTSGEVINFLISSCHLTRAFNSHRFPDDNPSIICIVIIFPTITFSQWLRL